MDSYAVLANLEGLGTTAHEVATSLRKKGVRGIRGNKLHCPLAVYVKQVIGKEATATPSEGVRVGDVFLTRLPLPAVKFLLLFDQGAFPDLVLPPREWSTLYSKAPMARTPILGGM